MYSEIQHNNLYISVSRQHVCPKRQSWWHWFPKPLFWTRSEGEHFRIWWDMAIFPLHSVTFPWYQFIFMRPNQQNSKNGFFLKFQPYGVYGRVLLVSGTQVSRLVRSFSSDSPSLRKNIFMGHLSIFDYLFLAASSLDSFVSKHSDIANSIREISDWFLQETVDNVIDFNNTRMFQNRMCIFLNRG